MHWRRLTGIENDQVVVGKLSSDGLPEGLEVGGRLDDTSRARMESVYRQTITFGMSTYYLP
jgi:hypothetical protein